MFHVKLNRTISPISDCRTAADVIHYCFEISPLLSNIELNCSTQSVRTNPIGRNDDYGKRHILPNPQGLATNPSPPVTSHQSPVTSHQQLYKKEPGQKGLFLLGFYKKYIIAALPNLTRRHHHYALRTTHYALL